MFTFEDSFYKELFRSLDNNAVLMRVEEDGAYFPVWCSKEFTEMMEGSEEDFIRLESGGAMATVHPDDREEMAYLFRHHVTRAGTNNLNVRKRTVKGNWIWVNIHYAFVKNNGVQYAYCNYFDVTELKESQRQTLAMYDSLNAELNALADESLAALRSNLTKGVVEEVRGKDLYEVDKVGAPIGDLMEVRLANMPLEEDRKKYREIFDLERLQERYYLGEPPASLVIFSKRQSGRQCFINYSASMRKDPVTGDVIVLGVETECNTEKVNEILYDKVLAEQYDMITYLVNGQYGVVIGDADRIQRGSIFPRTRNGVYNDYIIDQVVPVIRGTVMERTELLQALSLARVEKELETKESYEVDIVCDIDGEDYYKRFVFYPVDREAKFYILLKSDTTALQREQIQRNEQLKTALEEANQANVAKTAFLSSMSHEIRTPMNAIIGLDNIALKEPDLPPRTREQLEKIGGSARHLLGLINDILDMSRIESGRMVLKNEEFSFRAMLEQINTMINGQCQDKGLQYECIIHGAVAEYYIGDDMKLKQVLINILGNGVKFTPAPGKVTLTVEQAVRFEDQSTLRFVIKDTGIGMDKEYIPKIFEAFSQEDATTTNKYGGSGLGMAITKNIVEMMNGSITVTSEKGVGSEFTVNVTLRNTDRTDGAGKDLRPQDLHVLVIDDDPVACEHAKLVLEEVGVSADICLSGAEALEMIKLRYARRESYNLILVDLKMPEQDGIEVTEKIRELIGNESAIVILTAYSWEDVAERAIGAGVDSFMSKPLFASGVLEEFRQAMRKKDIAHPVETRRVELAGRRILLAEDMLINAEIMMELLEMRDIAAEHAENGQIAVDMFQKSPPGYYDAILMDVRMPVLDGLGATAVIRALEREDARTIPIIAMTANAFDEDVQRSLQAGMSAHLTKPVELEHLYETLSGLIREK